MGDVAVNYRCKYCDKTYKHATTLRKHIRTLHVGPVKTMHCKEEGCTADFKTRQELANHLTNIHALSFLEETAEFLSMDEFKQWKDGLERKERSSFKVSRGSQKSNDYSVMYFSCNRSGSYKSTSTGKRKVNESCKVGQVCTAYITVRVSNVSGSVSVKFCRSHYGHQSELRHIRLTEAERSWVAAQCAEKVSNVEILNKIRDSLQDSVERLHLITRVDIANIERASGLRGIERHRDDRTSLMLYLAELKELGDQNPILCCKLQGEKYNNLDDDDVFLVIQNPLQQCMLREFGSNIVCLDATHGTNGYDFKLVSVMVVDEFGEGFPAAWCISTREDFFTLREFFSVIRQKCGPVQPKWFMSDIAEQYSTAWTAVFGDGPKKLLCTWHVDRAWRNNLRKHFSTDMELQCIVYKTLRVLLEEPSVERFEELAEQVKEDFTNDARTAAFGKYFNTYYLSRPEQWAYCHRRHAGINTNMYAEAFHRVLKHVYMQGKVNKRLDRCVFLLLSLIRDKGFDRLIKLKKGKPTSRLSTIEARHRKSLELSLEQVEATGDNTYSVPSEKGKNKYLVTIAPHPCEHGCRISCSVCRVCVHTTSCTCTDSIIHGVICKHVHLVCRYRRQASETSTDVVMPEEMDEHVDVATVVSCIGKQGPSRDADAAKADFLQRLAALHSQVSACPAELSFISEMRKHLSAMENLAKLQTVSSKLPSASNIPPNKNLEQQRPLILHKRKRTAQGTVPKPTLEEKTTIASHLANLRDPSVFLLDHTYVSHH